VPHGCIFIVSVASENVPNPFRSSYGETNWHTEVFTGTSLYLLFSILQKTKSGEALWRFQDMGQEAETKCVTLRHDPCQIFKASKTLLAGLYTRKKWRGESGTSELQGRRVHRYWSF
jgi:hypothetical protein